MENNFGAFHVFLFPFWGLCDTINMLLLYHKCRGEKSEKSEEDGKSSKKNPVY